MADEIKEEIQELEELTEVLKDDEEIIEDEIENSQDDELEKEDDKEEKKKKLIKKILFSVLAFLVSLIIIGFILYLVGFFDPEEKPIMKVSPKVKVEDTKYNFNINDIDTRKINKQLLLLTNKELKAQEAQEKKIRLRNLEIEKKLIEKQKKKKEAILAKEEEKIKKEKEILEKKKIELQKQKDELEKLKKEALLLRDAMIKNKQTLKKDIIKEVIKQPEEEKEVKVKEPTDETFISLINVAKIKDNLYKSYLDKIVAINPDIKLCRDDKNIIEIYFGPFNKTETRDMLFNKLQEKGFKEAYKVELTNKEFIKRCKY